MSVWAKMTEEQKERKRKNEREYARKKYQALSKEERWALYQRHKEYRLEYARKRLKTDPEFRARQKAASRKSSLKRAAKMGGYTAVNRHYKYGLSPDAFEELWAKQSGLCGICKTAMKKTGRDNRSTVVDHNHETGKVRGLLHRTCNRTLGHLEVNLGMLQSMLDWISK